MGKRPKKAYEFKLAILIPTLYERLEVFNETYGELLYQLRKNNLFDKVLIKYYPDDGKLSTGRKRNLLIKRVAAKCEYLAFFDDDDRPADDYIKTLYDTLMANPGVDVVNFIVEYTMDGKYPKPLLFSKRYKSYIQEPSGRYKRPPGHLSAMKTKIAHDFKFPDITQGEDVEWAMKISDSGRIKTEVNIDRVLYYYLYDSTKNIMV